MPERRPRVLVVTTNFPLERRGDRTGNFVYDPVLALAYLVATPVLCVAAAAGAGALTLRGGRSR